MVRNLVDGVLIQTGRRATCGGGWCYTDRLEWIKLKPTMHNLCNTQRYCKHKLYICLFPQSSINGRTVRQYVLRFNICINSQYIENIFDPLCYHKCWLHHICTLLSTLSSLSYLLLYFGLQSLYTAYPCWDRPQLYL